jgi:Flp pilus assembly protein TadG
MKKKVSFLIRDESGVITALTVIMMAAFVGLLALVIDLGHLHIVQNELQNASDDCALRGARGFFADNLTGIS